MVFFISFILETAFDNAKTQRNSNEMRNKLVSAVRLMTSFDKFLIVLHFLCGFA